MSLDRRGAISSGRGGGVHNEEYERHTPGDNPEECDDRQLLAAIRKARRNAYRDPMYHSGREKNECGSQCPEFLDTLERAARRRPHTYESERGHADGMRRADGDAGERALNEVIHECQRSLERIGRARTNVEARKWTRGMGLKE